MAKDNDRILTSENRADTVVYDKYGNEISRLTFSEREYEEGDVDIQHTESDSVECGDGSLTSHRKIMQGEMLLAICDRCKQESQPSVFRRHPAQVPFSPASKIRRCVKCRAAVCGRHGYVSTIDKHIRCRHCNHWHFWGHYVKRILKGMFFKKAGENS